MNPEAGQPKAKEKTLSESLVSDFRAVDSQQDAKEVDKETFYKDWYTFVSMKMKENKTMTVGSTLVALGRLLRAKNLEYDLEYARKMRKMYLVHTKEDILHLTLNEEQNEICEFIQRFLRWRTNTRLIYCLRLFIIRSGIHSISSFRRIALADINRFVIQGLLCIQP